MRPARICMVVAVTVLALVGIAVPFSGVFAVRPATANQIAEQRATAPRKYSLYWDLVRDRTVAQFDKKPTGDLYIYEGDLSVDIRIAEGIHYTGKADLVNVSFEDQWVRSILISTPSLTLDEAFAQAAAIIRAWKMDFKNLDEWHSSIAGKTNLDDTFYSYRSNVSPSLSLELKHSYSKEKPWFIYLSVHLGDPPKK